MSGLAALLAGHNPPDVYQWHSAAHVEDIEHAVEKAGWRFVHLDAWTVEDKESFLKSTAAAFSFPDHVGQDFDALGNSLREVSPHSAGGGSGANGNGNGGIVLLWDGWSPLARHDEQCFRDALNVLGTRVRSEAGCRFAVLLRGDGPTLELPELPVKHA